MKIVLFGKERSMSVLKHVDRIDANKAGTIKGTVTIKEINTFHCKELWALYREDSKGTLKARLLCLMLDM